MTFNPKDFGAVPLGNDPIVQFDPTRFGATLADTSFDQSQAGLAQSQTLFDRVASRTKSLGMGAVDLFAPTVSEIGMGIAANLPEQQKQIGEVSQGQQFQANKIQEMAKSGQISPERAAQLGQQSSESLYQTPEELERTPLQAGGSGLQTAALFAPMGTMARGIGGAAKGMFSKFLGEKAATGASKLAGATGSSAATGYGVDVGMNLSEGQEDMGALKPGLGTAIGAAIPPGLSATVMGGKAALNATGAGLASQAPRVINSLIKPLQKQFTFGRDPGKTVAKLGITANSMEELATEISLARNLTGRKIREQARQLSGLLPDKEADSLLTKVEIQAQDALQPFDEAIAEAISTNDQSLLNRLNESRDAITKIFSSQGGKISPVGSRVMENLTYEQALDVKQLIGKLTKWTNNVHEDQTVNGALARTYAAMKDKMDDSLENIDPQFAAKMRELNEDYAGLQSAEVATKYRDIIDKRLNLIGLPGKVGLTTAAIASAFSAGPAVLILGIASIGLDKALGSTAFKTRLAKWLAKAKPADKASLFEVYPDLAKFSFPGDKMVDEVGAIAEEAGTTRGFLKMGGDDGLKGKAGEPNNAFQGFDDLSTKLLEKLKGRTTVSKQFISDLTNSPDLKQPERDLIRRVLADEADSVSVPDFANRVKSELLPLKMFGSKTPAREVLREGGGELVRSLPQRYESVNLPDELRGPVANYEERIYESPIKTSAGRVHFGGQSENYFAHTRIEDLPVQKQSTSQWTFTPQGGGKYKVWNQETGKEIDKVFNSHADAVKYAKSIADDADETRRVIEIQSDLFQKGRLEGEVDGRSLRMAENNLEDLERKQLDGVKEWNEHPFDDKHPKVPIQKAIENAKKHVAQSKAEMESRTSELSKLEPYRNTWWERIVREEVRQAAKDGKTKLQFPTGETAMKIEGLGGGGGGNWYTVPAGNPRENLLKVEDLHVGRTIYGHGDNWVITEVTGEGRFKAVPENAPEQAGLEVFAGPDDFVDFIRENNGELPPELRHFSEAFDISGKVDTNNPIFRFYEKEVQKYLRNKYGGKVITDKQGVTWVEVDVPKDAKKLPIEAFGAGALPVVGTNEEE